MAGLEEAIQATRQSLSLVADDHPDRPIQLRILAENLSNQYQQTGSVEYLEEAIEVARQAILLLPEGQHDHASYLNSLGTKLALRFQRMGEMRDLDEAIEVARQAISDSPEEHPDRLAWLCNLGAMLSDRFHRIGDMVDLEEAIGLTRQAVNMIPGNHPFYLGSLINLSFLFDTRFEQTGQIEDLDEAINIGRQTNTATPKGHPYHADSSNSLGVTLFHRYEHTGDVTDLEEAIEIAHQAVDAITQGHINYIAWMNNLGVMVGRLYERTGDLAHLQQVIHITGKVLDMTPEDSPDRPVALSNFSAKLQLRYCWTGDVTDLEQAIRLARDAVEATPKDHPARSPRLNNLAIVLGLRHERTGDMLDLDEAIQFAHQAIDTTPEDQPSRASRLSNLGNLLGLKHERTGEIANLQEAIKVLRQATDSLPQSHSNYLPCLSNLANKLSRRYEHAGTNEDLEEAIRMSRQVVDTIPEDHPDQSAYLNNFANKLQSRYELTGGIVDLNEAISVARQAVEKTPKDHTDRSGRLYNLGTKLESRFERNGEVADITDAVVYFQQAWHVREAVPFRRIQAGSHCLKLLTRQNKVEAAILLGKEIIHLLPSVNTRLLSRKDQQYVVSNFTGIASGLCALLLTSNKPEEALAYLEKGRAVILGQLIDSRNDVSGLAQNHPNIAHHYEELRNEINIPLNDLGEPKMREKVIQRRRKAISDMDICIEKIRSLPGYERFLLSQTTAEMQKCAAEGAIVVVNITELRSDAIVVSSAGVKTIELPNLSAFDTKTWLRMEWNGRRVRSLLGWLWRSCVKQILEELRAMNRSAEEDLLRVWWIGSGLAASLPFHAAGIPDDKTTENAYSRTVSSYVPSIKALFHAQTQAKDLAITSGSLLFVAMPTTPAKIDLNFVGKEKDKVLEASKGYISAEKMDHPDVEGVISGIQGCSIAHFACHGETDFTDPSNSGLIFQKQLKRDDDQAVHLEQNRLTVQKVSELNLRHAQIAYLSACSTAQNGAERLADEVIHIVSGFQVAGFPHVVGCLWPSYDEECAKLAGRFYSSIFRHGDGWWETRRVAFALRDAVMASRSENIRWPLKWAQYVHYGP